MFLGQAKERSGVRSPTGILTGAVGLRSMSPLFEARLQPVITFWYKWPQQVGALASLRASIIFPTPSVESIEHLVVGLGPCDSRVIPR